MHVLKLNLLPGLLAGLAIVAAMPSKSSNSPSDGVKTCGDDNVYKCSYPNMCLTVGESKRGTCEGAKRCCRNVIIQKLKVVEKCWGSNAVPYAISSCQQNMIEFDQPGWVVWAGP